MISFRRYALLAGAAAAAVCASVFALNALIDPLWHFGGNRLNGINRPFNEREAKLNRLLRDLADYDCLIFGSSRATLMPAAAFRPHRCFNLAFSSGQIEEFIAFARYLHAQGMQPQLIVVGVDGFNFMVEERDPASIPEFVRRQTQPEGVLQTYLSIDALRMSMQALSRNSVPRYYDDNFDGAVAPDAPRFDPSRLDQAEGLARGDAAQRSKIPFASERAALYGELITVFPQSRALAYVPPISAWHVAGMARAGTLDSYLDALHATARLFPRMIDFSVPDDRTRRTDNTYDGSHYSVAVNHDMAAQLMADGPPAWGVDVSAIGRDVYQSRYRQALLAFRDAQEPHVSAHAP